MEKSDESIVEMGSIAELQVQLGSDQLKQLIERFSSEINELITQIRETYQDRANVEDLISQIHKSAGSSAALGINAMKVQLNLMETSAKSGKPENIWIELPRLVSIWRTVQKTLIDHGLLED